MDEQSVLALGIFVLAGSAAGLFFSHRGNRLLIGLDWMGAALLVGSGAAGCFMLTLHDAVFRPAGDLLLLLAFLLGNRATRICVEDTHQKDRADYLLLSGQGLISILQWCDLLPPRFGALLLSIVLGISIERSARMLLRAARGSTRSTTLFAAVLLRISLAPDLLRGLATASGFLDGPARTALVDTLTYGTFIVSGTVFAFSLFARTTAQLTDKLEQVASTDPLTRVFNRRAFLAWCEKEWTRSARSGQPFSVLLVDLDHFKRINDSFGHHTGDAVLCAAVEAIQNAIRGVDVLCRWGGEEFAVLLPSASREAVVIVAQRIQGNIRRLAHAPNLLPAGESAKIQFTASIGAGTWLHPSDTIDAILRRADAALYAAKEAGRDRVMLDTFQKPFVAAPAPTPALV